MNFNEAFKAMKDGKKVKLPSWAGYWCWNTEKATVEMHCKSEDCDAGEGPVLDIRETDRVEYTLSNICSDDWMIADETNCELLGGETLFSFSEALKYLRRGEKVTRKGWNGKDQWLCKIPHSNNCWKGFPMQDCIGLKNIHDEMQPGWVPSQGDLFADDWQFYRG